jgi:hypothetical protein
VDFLLEALPVDFWGALSALMPLEGAATIRATVPPIRPAKAAVANTELFETFMVFPLLVLECFQFGRRLSAFADFGKYTGKATGDTCQSQERMDQAGNCLPE